MIWKHKTRGSHYRVIGAGRYFITRLTPKLVDDEFYEVAISTIDMPGWLSLLPKDTNTKRVHDLQSVAQARFQSDMILIPGQLLVYYRCEDPGPHFNECSIRPEEEFYDGRFEKYVMER